MTDRTAGELARFLNCSLEGDASVRVRGVASPENASVEDVIYLESTRHAERVLVSNAKCVITAATLGDSRKTLLLTSQPKVDFSRAAAWLMPSPPIALGIHPTAVIAGTASIAAGVAIGPFAVIEDGVDIGEDTQIGAYSFVGRGAKIGTGCRLYPHVTIYAGVAIKDFVTVHSGAVLGSDGFGYVTHEGRHWKFPQLGGLEIGSSAEIGANATIDRGSLGTTRLGEQVKLDNMVHVAHNVQIGDRTLIAAQTGIAGSCFIGKDVVIGGQAGIADHCRLEDGCIVGAQSGIPTGKTVRSGVTVWGCPARPLSRVKKQYAWSARLPEMAERLRVLEETESRKP